MHFRQGGYTTALADFDAALQRMPDFAGAQFYHGLTLMALGRCKEGEAELHAPGLKMTPLLTAALTEHRDAVAKAGCSVETL